MNKSIAKRFWDNRRDNIMRGPTFTIFKGLKMPTHDQMDKLEKYGIVYDVDPEIRDMVIELNDKGFKTLGSCAGHMPNKINGFVSFSGKPTEHKIKVAKSILQKHGMVNIRFVEHEIFWSLKFRSVGLHELRKKYKKK